MMNGVTPLGDSSSCVFSIGKGGERGGSKKDRILLANLLQGSRSTFSYASFPSFFTFKEGIWDTQVLTFWSSPTVSDRFVRQHIAPQLIFLTPFSNRCRKTKKPHYSLIKVTWRMHLP